MASDFQDDDTDAPGARGGTKVQALISVDGAVTTKLLPSSGELSIGRSASSDLAIRHASVSRRHATLRLSPLEIIDEGSRNGTLVRGAPLVSGVATSLAVGEAIQIGEATILLQLVTLSLDRAPSITGVVEPEARPAAVDNECARSARPGAPFAVVHATAIDADPAIVIPLVRGSLRTSDVVTSDGHGNVQLLLVDTGGQHAQLAVSRVDDMLRAHGIRARFGVARYPEDGVVAEQLIAHAYERLERDAASPPGAMDPVRAIIRQMQTAICPSSSPARPASARSCAPR